jgi:HK97 family phage prohead protease
MPYFITDEAADCDGWATIKEDGEVIGCHDSKQDAIDQMVAVSIAENIEPGGERALGALEFVANMRAKDSLGVDMKQEVEMRQVEFSDIEMRQTEDAPGDVPMTFRGYAAVFNSPSEDMGFREYIKPGAFAKSLKSRNSIRMFMNHNSDIVLASTRAKTLRLIEDDKGLLVDADLPDTTAGRDLSVLLQRGDVDSMSFGFSVPPKGETWSDDGSTRELHAVRLHEVSVVTGWPAYPATSASVRSFEILAERTNTNADELAEAITLLENGAELDSARADLLTEVVSKLRQEPPASLLGLKQKHLDLLAKTI